MCSMCVRMRVRVYVGACLIVLFKEFCNNYGIVNIDAVRLVARRLSFASEQNHLGSKALILFGKLNLISPTWPRQAA